MGEEIAPEIRAALSGARSPEVVTPELPMTMWPPGVGSVSTDRRTHGNHRTSCISPTLIAIQVVTCESPQGALIDQFGSSEHFPQETGDLRRPKRVFGSIGSKEKPFRDFGFHHPLGDLFAVHSGVIHMFLSLRAGHLRIA